MCPDSEFFGSGFFDCFVRERGVHNHYHFLMDASHQSLITLMSPRIGSQ